MKSEQKFARQLDLFFRNSDLKDEANSFIDSVMDDIRQGHDDRRIRKERSSAAIPTDSAIEVARARISVSGKFSRWNRLWMDSYSASYSTPEEVGKYRGLRLSGSRIVDIGCGAGMQSVFFSERSEVTAIEVSHLRTAMAKLNAIEYGCKLSKVVNADYTGVLDSLPIDSDTTLFSDPLRPRTEDERTLSTLLPSPLVVRKMAGGRTERFVFDLPPQMSWQNLSLEGEKEYISMGGRLNRLTLYQGGTAEDGSSAVILPERVRISGSPEETSFPDAVKASSLIFLPDISLRYARLLGKVKELAEFRLLEQDGRRTVLTSDETPDSYLPGEVFRLLDTCDGDGLTDALRRNECGRVIPRFSMDPSEYYGERKKIEESMQGDRDIYLFRHGSAYLLCEKAPGNSDMKVNPHVMKRIDY